MSEAYDALDRSRALIGDRGKYAEKEVKKMLVRYEAYSSFAWYRLPDARAGSLKATLADFLTMHKGALSLVEVKQVDHAFRLPYKNFDEKKVARVRAWAMAGAEGWVMMYFTQISAWRLAPIDAFLVRTSKGGSWDFSGRPMMTLEQVMEKVYGPPPPKRA